MGLERRVSTDIMTEYDLCEREPMNYVAPQNLVEEGIG